MRCTKMIAARTPSGRVKKHKGQPAMEQCGGTIEANTKIFLDMEAEPLADDPQGFDITVTQFTVADVNDLMHDEESGMVIPLNVESELVISCDDCGQEYAGRIAKELRKKIASQPIGDAPRILGARGGA